jgi:hypothetical protein
VNWTPRSGTRWRSGDGGTIGESVSRDDGADSQKRSVVETTGKSSGSGGVGGAGGKKRREKKSVNQRFMEIVADIWEPASLFVVSGVPGASPLGRGQPRDAGDRIETRRTKNDFKERG